MVEHFEEILCVLNGLETGKLQPVPLSSSAKPSPSEMFGLFLKDCVEMSADEVNSFLLAYLRVLRTAQRSLQLCLASIRAQTAQGLGLTYHTNSESPEQRTEVPRRPPGSALAPKPRRFPRSTLRLLTQAVRADPYPPAERVAQLETETGLSKTQLANWFTNYRRRHLRKPNDPAKSSEHNHSTSSVSHHST